MSAVPEPTRREDRIGMLDTTRGIAVLGILLMNITGFGLPYAYDDPTNWGGHEGTNLLVWRINALFFEGTMRGLFTVLFGAGALLFLQRHAAHPVQPGPAKLYFRRMLWLIAFGLVNGYVLLWDGDILFYYGVTGLLLYVFRNIDTRRLIVAAALIMTLQTLVTVVEWAGYNEERGAAVAAAAKMESGRPLNAREAQAIETFAATNRKFEPTPTELETAIAEMRGSYGSAFAAVKERTRYVETAFFLRHGLLESLGMMVLGMALFRLGILSGTAPVRVYAALILLGYALGLSVNLYEVRLLETSGFSTQALMQSYLTYDLGRIPMTLGHIGLIGLLCRREALTPITRPFAAAGQMALTNYLSQSVICMFLFTGAGLALYGQLQRYQLYYVVAAISAVQLVWSVLWLRHFRFGPAEWLWRSLTYGRLQPMRREGGTETRHLHTARPPCARDS